MLGRWGWSIRMKIHTLTYTTHTSTHTASSYIARKACNGFHLFSTFHWLGFFPDSLFQCDQGKYLPFLYPPRFTDQRFFLCYLELLSTKSAIIKLLMGHENLRIPILGLTSRSSSPVSWTLVLFPLNSVGSALTLIVTHTHSNGHCCFPR